MKIFSLRFQIVTSVFKLAVPSCQRKLLPIKQQPRWCHSIRNPDPFHPGHIERDVILANLKPETVQRVTKLFNNSSEKEVLEAIVQEPGIRRITQANLESRYRFLTKRDITPEMMLQHPWLLTENRRLLEIKMGLLDYQTSDMSSTVYLLRMPIDELKKFLQQNVQEDSAGFRYHSERISFLSKHLQCDEKTTWELLEKYKFLLTIPLDRLKAVLALLEEYNVNVNDIRRDPYILCYFPEVIQPRLEEARQAGMKKIKPWLARSHKAIFYKSLERFKAIQEQLGSDTSIAAFLTRKLELTDSEQADEILHSYPPLMSCSAKKLGMGINNLKKEGYTCEQIAGSPRVLAPSISTILGRLKVLREFLKVQCPQLYLLYLSNKDFNKQVARLQRKSKWRTKRSSLKQ